MALKVRKLTNGDMYQIMKIIAKSTDEVKKALKEMNGANISNEIFGIIILESAMKSAEKDLKEFLADLVGKTAEEFEELPFDASLEILETLDKQEDLPRFLGRATKLMNKIFGPK